MFLKIKKVPKTKWSSEKPYNFKPKFSTIFFCCFGLMLFGLGEGLLIVSFTGASPWSVLAQGISLNVNLSIGMLTFLISVTVLILWIPLGQKPGMATFLNALIIALMIDICIKFVPTPTNYYNQLILAIISIILAFIPIVGWILMIFLYWLYFAIQHSSKSQATLGMKALDIKIYSENHGKIGFWRASGNYFVSSLSALLLFIGFFMIGFTARKQGLHNFISRTIYLKDK